ncbi:MAG: VPLPA-CTERM sorting domain-containing protein [Pseudomonadota bacterium]
MIKNSIGTLSAITTLVIGMVLPGSAIAASVSLSGNNADGYLAVVGVNQEFGIDLSDISRDINDPKYFDYPIYVNPSIPTNAYIMVVEPYRFGLSFPDPLHPIGPGSFLSVGNLQPASACDGFASCADAGVTFIEGVTEDIDFSNTDIGTITYDEADVSATGTSIIGVGDFSLNLDGTEFQATNRTELNAGDVPPFGPDGRSNRNESANIVNITASNLTGTGLTFEDGVLQSIDFVADVDLAVLAAAFPFPSLGLNATGTLVFAGNHFAFDVEGQDSNAFASNVRLLLNREGTITSVVPIPAAVWLFGSALLGLITLARRRSGSVT